ncbi:cupredoxin domain-containing protein [Brevibacillus panacihumi]|uniref:cupredoxin domain-containing protein n=1 Tax=Brevibacillus panacihumi TaxID=497735 RepID=UPI003D0062EF
MSIAYQVLIYVGLSYVCFTWFIWKRIKRLDPMQGMMSGMSMGMMIGLIGGLLLGVIYKGNLFLSTMWGMLLGGATGFIIGIPLSILSIVEGTLSGIMGGMMGAMLGEMVPNEKVEPLLFIFIMLFTACILLLSKFIEEGTRDTVKAWWILNLHHPITPAIMLFGVFLWFQTLPFISLSANNDQAHNEHKNRNRSIQEVSLTAVDFSYQPNQITLKKNIPFKVILQNKGKVEHDIEVVTEGKIMIIVESDSGHQHGSQTASNVHLHAKPGESAESVWKAMEEGTYIFYCTIPGHKESGMIGRLIVM